MLVPLPHATSSRDSHMNAHPPRKFPHIADVPFPSSNLFIYDLKTHSTARDSLLPLPIHLLNLEQRLHPQHTRFNLSHDATSGTNDRSKSGHPPRQHRPPIPTWRCHHGEGCATSACSQPTGFSNDSVVRPGKVQNCGYQTQWQQY